MKTDSLQKIHSKTAPSVVGPYSQAIKAGKFVFCSGQIGLDPKNNSMVKGGVEKETKQVLKNLSMVLKASGVSSKNVVRVDIFLTDINDFAKVNAIYAKCFTTDPKPARQTVAVASLPKGAKIEVSCIAYVNKQTYKKR
ncbi:MAG: Rid family detoxifying hydrolase [bacterium]|nr:Rid family detoxifying hydrolase [bacterium]